jgi:hypothetical protein
LTQGELGYETDTGKFKLGIDHSTTWTSLPYGGLNGPQSTQIQENFGNGSDGNVTISSGTITMTRDMYYNNLTINGTGQLATNNYRLFISGTLDVSGAGTGAINNNGTSASPTTGSGQTNTAQLSQSVGGGLQGGGSGGGTTNAVGSVGNNGASYTGPGNGGLGGSGGALAGGGLSGTGYTWITRMSPRGGTSWSTVDTYTYPGGSQAVNIATTTDSLGNIYCGGWGLNIPAGSISIPAGSQHSIVRKSSNAGETWITVDDYIPTGATGAQCHGMGTDLLGNIYALIWLYTTSSATTWIVRKSTDQGATWNTVDSYIFPGGSGANQPIGMTVDSAGNIYVLGQSQISSGSFQWVTRKSPDNGTTWTTVDIFQYQSGQSAGPSGITVDNAGNIYTVGYGTTSTSARYWIVRQSTNQGATWATVDNYLYTGGVSSWAQAACKDSLGNVYVGGFGRYDINGYVYHWIVRQSTNNGVTWTTIDDFLYANFNQNGTTVFGMGADSSGNVYASGYAVSLGGNSHWLTRQSTNNGSTWTTVDDYKPSGLPTAQAQSGVSVDTSGNLYVSGINSYPTISTSTQATPGTGSVPTGGNFAIRYAEIELLKGVTQIRGGGAGGGGGGGGGDFAHTSVGGGAGGNGAGVLAVFANIIARGTNTNPGIFQANGGNGGNTLPTNLNNSGVTGAGAGGGGGGGGWAFIQYNTLTGSTLVNGVQASGGNGGTGGNGLNNPFEWIVRKTSNGTTWTTVDTYMYGNGFESHPLGITGDSAGNIYACGDGIGIFQQYEKWIVRKSTNNGVTWSTVDNYLYPSVTGPTQPSAAVGMCSDNLGYIYASGNGTDSSNIYHGIMRQSTNGGSTWTTVDDFVYAAGKNTVGQKCAADSLGNVFYISYASDSGGLYHWVVRQSTNNGSTWTTVDDYTPLSGTVPQPESITIDSLGNIYVSGAYTDLSGVRHGLVRMSTNHGSTWSTVLDYIYSAGYNSNINAVFCDSSNNVYGLAYGTNATAEYWLVLQSTNMGVTWNVIDIFLYSGGTASTALGMSQDNSGNLYVCGNGYDSSGLSHEVVRQSTNNGATWTTVDDFVQTSGHPTFGAAIGKDTAGNIYVVDLAGYSSTYGPGNGGAGGNGGYGGWITLLNIPTGAIQNYISSGTPTSGSPGSGATGGVGGSGVVFQENL